MRMRILSLLFASSHSSWRPRRGYSSLHPGIIIDFYHSVLESRCPKQSACFFPTRDCIIKSGDRWGSHWLCKESRFSFAIVFHRLSGKKLNNQIPFSIIFEHHSAALSKLCFVDCVRKPCYHSQQCKKNPLRQRSV